MSDEPPKKAAYAPMAQWGVRGFVNESIVNHSVCQPAVVGKSC
jgi:hypothetical protein